MIRATGLSKSFDGGKTFALKGVNVEIQPGEFVAVIGLSGAGKSTFLRCINAMNIPSDGSLEVMGQPILAGKDRDFVGLRRQIGFVFQQFNLVKNLTAEKNVLCGRIAYNPLWRSVTGLYSSTDRTLAREALDSVGLKNRYEEKVRNLSGGQQQRVAIARALVQEPKVILADEPMASLDPRLSEVVLDILADSNRTKGITVLVNIHVLELAKKYASRILGFRAGELVFDGTPSELTDFEMERIYAFDKPQLEI